MQLLYLPKWSKLNKAGKAPIILRITIGAIRATYSTGLSTTRSGWNQGKEELRGTSEAIAKANKLLYDKKVDAFTNKEEFAKQIKKGERTGPLSARMVADSLRTELEEPAPAEPCALHLFTDLLTSHYAHQNLHTYQRIHSVLSVLRRWRGDSPLPLSILTLPTTGSDLLRWCSTNSRRGDASRAALVADVQALWRRATGSKEFLWPELARSPARPRRRVRLTKDHLKTLREAEGLTAAQHVARLAYLLAFHLHGSRLGVVLELTWQQIGSQGVSLELEKGGGSAVIPLSDRLLWVLSECRKLHQGAYVLPLLPDDYTSRPASEQYRIRKSKHACVHSALMYVADKFDLPKPLHPHTARHTAAKLITDAHGGDLRPANKLLRHSSLAVTEIYVGSMSDEELNVAADKMYALL